MRLRIIVSNQTQLSAKYKTGTSDIYAAVQELMDRTKDTVPSVWVDLSGSEMSTVYGGQPVTTWSDQQAVKNAIDAVFATLERQQPTTLLFLLIVGGPDVVPLQTLQNPVKDKDANVPSDLPYACDAPYSSNPATFVAPTRMVGRIPDVPGQGNAAAAAAFAHVILNAATFQPRPAGDYEEFFALAAAVWRFSAAATTRMAYGSGVGVQLSPPAGPAWGASQLAPVSHMIMLHGNSQATSWAGEDPNKKQPTAITTAAIDDLITDGTIVAAQCCFSGQIWQSSGKVGFATTYLQSGAVGYSGATNLCYGPPNLSASVTYGDALNGAWAFFAGDGQPLGLAYGWARYWYQRTGHVTIDPQALKTLAQFVLLGDPALVATQAVNDVEDSYRRLRLQAEFARRAVATPEEVPDSERSAAVEAQLRAEAARRGLPEPYRIVSYRSVWRGDDAFRAEAGELPLIHLLHADPNPGSAWHTEVVLTAWERGGAIVAFDEAHQR